MDDVSNLFKLVKDAQWDNFIKILKQNDDININFKDESGNYLIHYAIIFRKIDAISLLISRGANLDIVDNDGRSILYVPIKFGYDDILDLLINFNNVNIGVSIIDLVDKNMYSALHYAIIHKNGYAVKKIISIDENIDRVEKTGKNALHLAVFHNSESICRTLLKTSIDKDAKTEMGETPLHIACNMGNNVIIEMLIDAGVKLDEQEIEYQYTPLHYLINLGNIKSINYMIEHGADVNKQDFIGNSILHHAIYENNHKIIKILLKNPSLNCNLYNNENRLPLHIIDAKLIDETIVAKSNLNFQDLTGDTPLHLLSKYGIWKKFIQILEGKKLNIFIRNRKGVRPIDHVNKDDITLYIRMATKSYLNILKKQGYVWRTEWEEKCKVDGDCEKQIAEKLMDIYKKNTESCVNTSFPVKKNKKCIRIQEGTHVDICMFIGTTIDILLGLIFLLTKHRMSCSTLGEDFDHNEKLARYYKSLGISEISRSEFLNFEIVWVNKRLFINENFERYFSKCVKSKEVRFIIIPLGIELAQGEHANYIIYDKKTNEVERFEPYGFNFPYKFDYQPKMLDSAINNLFLRVDESITYVSPDQFLPKIGLQFIESSDAKNIRIKDPDGFCAIWSIWYVDQRLTYPDVNRKSLIKKLMKEMKFRNISAKNTIRNYSGNITKLRDQILDKAKIDINDWVNENYDDDQIKIITNEIKRMIGKSSR